MPGPHPTELRRVSRFLDALPDASYPGGMARTLAAEDDGVTVRVAIGTDDPVERLRALKAADRTVERWLVEAVANARAAGSTWSAIGEALGVTRQAAWQLYNADLRRAVDEARRRSGLSEAEATARAADELRVVRSRRR